MKKSSHVPLSLWKAIKTFVTEELYLLFLYVCLVVQHGVIDLFVHGPEGCTRLIFDLAEGWAVIKALQTQQTARKRHTRSCTNRTCDRKGRRPAQRKTRAGVRK